MQTLEEAKKWLKERHNEGAKCPCCNQWSQLQKFSFHAGMVKSLLVMKMAGKENITDKDGFFHMEDYLKNNKLGLRGYHSKLKFWGMIEAKANSDKKKKWSGYWRLLDKGKDFLDGKIQVPKHAYLYNRKVFGFDKEMIFVNEVYHEYFDYEKLINASVESDFSHEECLQ